MKYQFKALQLSLAFHVLIILLVIGTTNSSIFLHDRIMVIDFTIEDSMNAGSKEAGTSDAKKIKTKFQQIFREKKNSVKNIEQEPEKQEDQDRETEKTIVKESVPDISAKISEEQVPVFASTIRDSQYTIGQAVQANLPSSNGNGIEGKGGEDGFPGKVTKMEHGEGYGNSDSDILSRKKKYLKENFAYIRDLIQRKITYPKLARQMGWEGKVIVSFIVKSDGHTEDIKIINSSGIEILDKSSIDAVKKASPFPKPPVEAQIIIPISYRFN